MRVRAVEIAGAATGGSSGLNCYIGQQGGAYTVAASEEHRPTGKRQRHKDNAEPGKHLGRLHMTSALP